MELVIGSYLRFTQARAPQTEPVYNSPAHSPCDKIHCWMVKSGGNNGKAPYINNSLHLARKYARIFVRGHYLFRETNSSLEENCELRGTDNVQGQISEQLLCLLSFKYFLQRAIGEYYRIFPSFSWGIFSHVMRLDQSRANKNLWWL